MDKYVVYKSIYGYIRIVYNESSILEIKYEQNKPEDFGEESDLTQETRSQLSDYFTGKRKDFELPICLKGTEFQKKVWKELSNIPYGETKTYKEIATLIGNDKASRAVGAACNKNPIMIVVPCHRVVGANGTLVGYAGGLPVKKQLLDMEKKYGIYGYS